MRAQRKKFLLWSWVLLQSERDKEMSPTNSVKGENKTGLGLYRIYLIHVLAICSESHGMST